MFQGQLAGIYLAARKRDELQRVDQAEAVAEKGLVGDRYFNQEGSLGKLVSQEREITLIESEAIDALARETEITLNPGQARRNLLTRGVPLNHLVGREFLIGDVVLRGLRLCEPCTHLEELTAKGVLKGLCHRGGLRAQILRGGVLRSGDAIRPRE